MKKLHRVLRRSIPILLKLSVMLGLLCALQVKAALAVPQFYSLVDGQIHLSQLDLTFQGAEELNSTYGLLAANTGQLPISSGFINVFDPRYATDAPGNPGWIVRNMPIVPGSYTGDYPGISTMFDLGNVSGTRVENLSLSAVASADPLTNFTGAAASTFDIGKQENNAQGAGGGPGSTATRPAGGPSARVNSTVVVNVPGAGTSASWQAGHTNLEQDLNQCMPAAVANSLQYLINSNPNVNLGIGDAYVPGIRDQTLVGKLDVTMQRPAHDPVASAQDFITGKLKYLNDLPPVILEDYLNVQHKERAGINWLDLIESDPGFPGENIYSVEDTSNLSLVDWMIKQVQGGSNVELRIGWGSGGGHEIDLIGGGYTLGVPWLAWVHDAKQGYVNDTTVALNGGINWYDGGIGWSPIINNKLVAYIGGQFSAGTVDFAVAESVNVPEPATVLLFLVGLIGVACVFLGRRRIASHT